MARRPGQLAAEVTMEGVRPTKDRVADLVHGLFPMARKHQVGPDVSLFAGGILDSLGVLDLVSALEREFAITVSDDDLLPENFHSISRIAAFVEGKLPVAPRPAPHDRAVRQGNDRNDA